MASASTATSPSSKAMTAAADLPAPPGSTRAWLLEEEEEANIVPPMPIPIVKREDGGEEEEEANIVHPKPYPILERKDEADCGGGPRTMSTFDDFFARPPEGLTVITWNTAHLSILNADQVEKFDPFMDALLSSTAPHVIALQELPRGRAKLAELEERMQRRGFVLQKKDGNENVFFVLGGIDVFGIYSLFETRTPLLPGRDVARDPLTMVLGRGKYKYAITSVHMPHNDGEARGKVTKELFGRYEEWAKAELQAGGRIKGLPFDKRGAKDARMPFTVHIVCGDFNTEMSEMADYVAKKKFRFASGGQATTGGGKNYDHFMVNQDAASLFALQSRVLTLREDMTRSTRLSKKGLSDHFPVALMLTESNKPILASKMKAFLSTDSLYTSPRPVVERSAAAQGGGGVDTVPHTPPHVDDEDDEDRVIEESLLAALQEELDEEVASAPIDHNPTEEPTVEPTEEGLHAFKSIKRFEAQVVLRQLSARTSTPLPKGFIDSLFNCKKELFARGYGGGTNGWTQEKIDEMVAHKEQLKAARDARVAAAGQP